MKSLRIVAYVGAAALAGIGVAMTISNPSQAEYEEYAMQQLTEYLKSDVCTKAPDLLGGLIKRNCSVLVDSSKLQIRQLVSQNTQRQNFILFSVYNTDLSVNQLLPAYNFETVGAFQNFYTYKAEKR